MKSRLILALVLSVLACGSANARCGDDPYTDCLDKLKDAVQELKQSSSVGDAIDNAKEAGSAVKECIECGLDNVKAGMGRIAPNSSGNK